MTFAFVVWAPVESWRVLCVVVVVGAVCVRVFGARGGHGWPVVSWWSWDARVSGGCFCVRCSVRCVLFCAGDFGV